MTSAVSDKTRLLCKLNAAAILYMATAISAFGTTNQSVNKLGYENLYKLVDEITEKKPNKVQDLENIIDTKLNLVDENAFYLYEIPGSHIKNIPIDLIDYRQPPLNGISSTGSFLRLKFGNICFTQKLLERHFKKMEFAGGPTDNNPEMEIYYFQNNLWGAFGFGFFEKYPYCLKTLTFDFKGSSGASKGSSGASIHN